MPSQTLLAQQDRGPGTILSAGRNMGNNPPALLTATFPLSAAQRDNPATAFTCGLDRLVGGVWVEDVRMTFVGGTTSPKTGLPREAVFTVNGLLPDTEYRGVLVLPTALNIGCTVSW